MKTLSPLTFKRYLCEEDSYNQGGQCHHGLGEPQLHIQQNQPTNKEYNAMMYSDDVLCIEDLIYLGTSKPGELVPWLAIWIGIQIFSEL